MAYEQEKCCTGLFILDAHDIVRGTVWRHVLQTEPKGFFRPLTDSFPPPPPLLGWEENKADVGSSFLNFYSVGPGALKFS